MRKEIAFMCLVENVELQRVEETNDILLVLGDNISNTIAMNNGYIQLGEISHVLYSQESNNYTFYHEDGNTTIDCNDSYIRVVDKEDGYVFEVCDINKHEDTRYRIEIVDDTITTYFVSGLYSKEKALLTSHYSLENLTQHIKIQQFMSGIISAVYTSIDPTMRFYIYYNNGIYTIDRFDTNVMRVTSVPIYDYETPESKVLLYEDMMNYNAMIFTSDMMFVYNDEIIKDGVVIGTTNKHGSMSDLGDILHSITSPEFNDSKLISIRNQLSHLESIITFIAENNSCTPDIKQHLVECIDKMKVLNEEFKNNEFMSKYECYDIIAIAKNNTLVYSGKIVDDVLTQIEQILSKTEETSALDIVDDYLESSDAVNNMENEE